jgi:hypothetical protein
MTLLLSLLACPLPETVPRESGFRFDSECTERLHYADADGDGYGVGELVEVCEGTEGYATLGGDCDDSDPLISPGTPEICDGVDQDCDELVDDGAADAQLWYVDGDRDGYAGDWVYGCEEPEAAIDVSSATDCDDDEASVHPGAEEVCGDEIDQDCDGSDAACP